MLWELLGETCRNSKLAIQDKSDAVDIKENEFQLEFIKERLGKQWAILACISIVLIDEVTLSIDRKIESIFKLAQEEQNESSLCELTDEFLEQLVEQVHDLTWLILSVPLQIGFQLWRRYRSGFSRVIEKIEGIERIWWSIRRGLSQIPRNRDYSTCDEFKRLPCSNLEDVRLRWDEYINQLREATSNEEEENSGAFKRKCHQMIRLTWTVFKKIKLKHLSLKDKVIGAEESDSLIDLAESIISVALDVKFVLSTDQNSLDHVRMTAQLTFLAKQLQNLVIIVSIEDDCWFENSLERIDRLIEEINEHNPMR
jgi:hypothetical protein